VQLAELRKLFLADITIAAICEPLHRIPEHAPSRETRELLTQRGFDVAGLKTIDGENAEGYVVINDLVEGSCGQHRKEFRESDLLSDATPLIHTIRALEKSDYRFVLSKDRVDSIATRADLQKLPVRMLAFGLITLFEMHLTDLLGRFYPNDSWKESLSSDRLANANRLMDTRKSRNEQLSLIDCLQLCDKRDLLAKNSDWYQALQFTSKKDVARRVEPIERLRDRLAHAQDLCSGSSWPEVIKLFEDLERLIQKCEEVESGTP